MRWLFFLISASVFGQSPPPTFAFADGVYWSHDALLANRPDADWSDVAGEMVQLTEDYRLLIDRFGYKSDRTLPRPYAVSLDGRPYLFVRADARRDYLEFAAPRIWGRWITVQYDTLRQNRYLMRAYNPTNGQPFREGYVDRQNWDRTERMVHLPSGRQTELSYAKVLEAVASEPDLVRALRRDPAAGRDKLLRALIVFNERYPLALPLQRPLD